MTANNPLECLGRHVAIFLVLLLALHFSPPANAEEGVLIESVPLNLDRATVLTVVRNALTYREWTILETFPAAVTAKISRGRQEARIRIALVDHALRYKESAVTTELSMKITKSSTPARWIDFLRSDISAELETRSKSAASQAPKETPKARGSTVQRMQELKQMLDSGLISAEDFERKKAEILKEL